MQTSRYIEHTGIIQEIEEQRITVTINSKSACAACHAKGHCSILDQKEKTINVIDNSNTYKIGEKVNVLMVKSQGIKALFLGYLLPFIILMATLIIVSEISGKEGLAGLLALGVLLPYYLILFLTRDHLKNSFSFIIQKPG